MEWSGEFMVLGFGLWILDLLLNSTLTLLVGFSLAIGLKFQSGFTDCNWF